MTGSGCSFCDYAATNPEAIRYDLLGCRQCRVRHVSQLPRHERLAEIESMPEHERQQFTQDVVDEFNRRQTWKRTR